jgi:hypothetical protein
MSSRPDACRALAWYRQGQASHHILLLLTHSTSLIHQLTMHIITRMNG